MPLTYEQYCSVFGDVSRDVYDAIHSLPLTIDDLPNIEKLYIVAVPQKPEDEMRKLEFRVNCLEGEKHAPVCTCDSIEEAEE